LTVDFVRDLSLDWGEPIIVKKPKGIASDLQVTGQWAVVVHRLLNGTGVLKVYLIQTKRYAFRLHFLHAKAPEWVLEVLKDILPDNKIGFEADAKVNYNKVMSMKDKVRENQDKVGNNQIEEEIEQPRVQETVVFEPIESVEEAWLKSGTMIKRK
jgi:hypothetical protein